MPDKPRVAVIGLGRYFEKLRLGMLKWFRPEILIDLGDTGSEPGRLYERLAADRPDAIMILTPNHFHSQQVAEVAPLRCPVLVEKPLATTPDGLDRVIRSLDTNPLLFCSDFYPDVRGVPLLSWFGRESAFSPNRVRIQGDLGLWMEGRASIGNLRSVEAALLEGEGDARAFDGREWLWNPIHGGVLWDLTYHYLTLSYVLLNLPLALARARLGSISGAPGDSAETWADLDLRSADGIRFSFRVAKYHAGANERWFRIVGDTGSAVMSFGKVNRVTIQSGGRSCTGTLVGDYYAGVSEAFRAYIERGPAGPHGLDAAREAVRVILRAKRRKGCHRPAES